MSQVSSLRSQKLSKNLKTFQKSENFSKIWKLLRNLKIVWKSNFFLKIWQFSKNLKCFPEICKNCQKSVKIVKNCKNCKKLSKIVKNSWKLSKLSKIIKKMSKPLKTKKTLWKKKNVNPGGHRSHSQHTTYKHVCACERGCLCA